MKKYKRIPAVGSVMTPFPYFVDADQPITEVERLMAAHDIHHVPVQENGRVAGIVSETDICKLAERYPPDIDKARIRAREVMVHGPYVVVFDTPLHEVALEMANRHIGATIVVHHEKLAGIISATDMCRILAEVFEAEFSSDGDDAA
jgi:CBS domain-containing protein